MARGHSTRGQAFSFGVDFKELDSMLEQLPKAMGKTVLRNALKKAGEPTKIAATANAVQRTGNLAGSIVVSQKLKRGQRRHKNRDRSTVEVFVGATAPHAYLVEWGSTDREHKSGKSTGSMPAQPFFRTAWDATKGEALRILVHEIQQELLKAAKRLRTKAGKGTLGKKAIEALS